MNPTRRFHLLVLTAVAAATPGSAADPPKAPIKSESFDRDPGWDAQNNRVVPKEYPTVVQDFGYGPTKFAGKAAGKWAAPSRGRRSRRSTPPRSARGRSTTS